MKKLLESTGNWANKYGWAVPTLAIGVVLGVIITEKKIPLEAVASLGTFGAAIAAFWAVFLNSQDQRRRREQEEEAKQPYLVISDANFMLFGGKLGNVSITFTNLSQHPIHIRDAVVWSDDDSPDVIGVGLLVLAAESATLEALYDVHIMEQGGLIFIFNYAPTGPILYSLSLPYKSRPMPRGDAPSGYRHTFIFFQVGDQELKTNVKDESRRVHELLEEMYSQHG